MEFPVERAGAWDGATVELVVPVYNEEAVLGSSVRQLQKYLVSEVPVPARITIVDSDSTDGTWGIARRLAEELPGVAAIRLPRTGKGLALRTAWARSTAPVVAYVDADLSTDLSALLPLLAPLLSGHSDLAIGTRLSRTSRVARGAKRELISRCYNLILRLVLRVGFSDAQCGFKAIRTDRVQQLLPLVEDDGWFFDAELLVLAERAGLRIHEVPVDWVDDPDSRVPLLSAAIGDLKGVVRLSRGLASGSIRLPEVASNLSGLGADPFGLPGQGVRFGLAGLAIAVLYVGIYLALRSFAGPQTANLIAFLITALVTTSPSSGPGFRVGGPRAVLARRTRAALMFAVRPIVTAASLASLETTVPDASSAWEALVLLVANGVATMIGFVLARTWALRTGSGERQREVV